jgi:hypothetical protein
MVDFVGMPHRLYFAEKVEDGESLGKAGHAIGAFVGVLALVAKGPVDWVQKANSASKRAAVRSLPQPLRVGAGHMQRKLKRAANYF